MPKGKNVQAAKDRPIKVALAGNPNSGKTTVFNALAGARAKALGLEGHDYMIATDLAGEENDFTSLISEWSAAPDPLAGLRVLDTARWRWLCDNEQWFSFLNDEIAVYGAKLMLLRRWQRLNEKQPAPAHAAPDN